jgi:hypothetical protein
MYTNNNVNFANFYIRTLCQFYQCPFYKMLLNVQFTCSQTQIEVSQSGPFPHWTFFGTETNSNLPFFSLYKVWNSFYCRILTKIQIYKYYYFAFFSHVSAFSLYFNAQLSFSLKN